MNIFDFVSQELDIVSFSCFIDNPGWWLCSPEVSIADIDLSLVLYRLWQLGFEHRMWEKNRPQLKRYFARVQLLASFHQAVTMTEVSPVMDLFSSPVFLGVLGTAVLLGGYYLWTKKGTEITSALQSLFTDENMNEKNKWSPVPHQRTQITADNPASGRFLLGPNKTRNLIF